MPYNIFNVLYKRRKTTFITPEMYLWHNKPIREKSVLLWDLENIPFNRLSDIKVIAKYTPQDLYVITKQPLSNKLRTKIEKEHFKILDRHKSISDDKIISIMKLYSPKPDMILISSDSDFVREVNNYITNNRLQWIIANVHIKSIIMRVNIGSTNLTVSTLSQKVKSKQRHQTKKIINIAAAKNSANIKSIYGPYQYWQYIKGVLCRSYQIYINWFKSLLLQLKEDKAVLLDKSTKIEDKTMPLMSLSTEIRYIFRYNYKSRRVVCGKIQINPDGEKILMIRYDLKYKYEMPKFHKCIRFSDFSEVSQLIYYDETKKEYFLNKFERA